MPTIESVIEENSRRLAAIDAPFDPISGLGSPGSRSLVVIPDFPIARQWLPDEMLSLPLLRQIAYYGSITGLLVAMGATPDYQSKLQVIEALTRLRCAYDFPFWAASFAYIKDKEPGRPDCLFRLIRPQIRYIEFLEDMRRRKLPIRVCMLKARQWGGSTATQMYMAWLQLVIRPSLNSLIIAHKNAASDKIKAMFHKMLERYPLWLLHPQGDTFNAGEKKLVWDGNSDSTQRVPQRNCTISVGSAESPNAARGGDYALVHISEIGLFKDTPKMQAADLIRSATSGVLYRPDTMIVYESTADGVGTFFHSEWIAAQDGHSQLRPYFVPWYEIERYSIPFENDAARLNFARQLVDGATSTAVESTRHEPGAYLWSLWQRGATLEAINWYIVERTKYNDHAAMAAEFPSDSVEAFANAGAAVFDMYQVNSLQPTCRPPLAKGGLHADDREGAKALRNIRFAPDINGHLDIWAFPDPADPQVVVSDRYVTVVDVGGRSDKADYSVILVLDRLDLLNPGGKVAVVAQWYGHTDIDILAWKAAQIAAFYDNSLLVIESNTIETHDPERSLDGGDQSPYILRQIADIYPNLYARPMPPDAVAQGAPRRYGFHTNTATKPMIIAHLIKVVREGMYIERDKRALDELVTYERRRNGSFAAIQGHHDDLLMTRAIGLHIAHNEMEPPRITQKYAFRKKTTSPSTEANLT